MPSPSTSDSPISCAHPSNRVCNGALGRDRLTKAFFCSPSMAPRNSGFPSCQARFVFTNCCRIFQAYCLPAPQSTTTQPVVPKVRAATLQLCNASRFEIRISGHTHNQVAIAMTSPSPRPPAPNTAAGQQRLDFQPGASGEGFQMNHSHRCCCMDLPSLRKIKSFRWFLRHPIQCRPVCHKICNLT